MLIRDARRQLVDLGPGSAHLAGREAMVTGQNHSHGGAATERSPWACELAARRRVTRAANLAAGWRGRDR